MTLIDFMHKHTELTFGLAIVAGLTVASIAKSIAWAVRGRE